MSILAYTAKYSSAFYGPFREAVGSSLQGDRKTYQQDPANLRESLRELALDLDEGADMVMVKPALPYLDVLARIADEVDVPLAAYQISGEYAMVEAAAEKGWIDRDAAILETLTGVKRAGAEHDPHVLGDRGGQGSVTREGSKSLGFNSLYGCASWRAAVSAPSTRGMDSLAAATYTGVSPSWHSRTRHVLSTSRPLGSVRYGGRTLAAPAWPVQPWGGCGSSGRG